MAERKKSGTTTRDRPPEHRLKRTRLTRSTSRFFVDTAAASTSESSHQACNLNSQTIQSSTNPSPPIQIQNSGAHTALDLASRLPELLDLTEISAHEDIAYRFGQIARSLLHEHILVISGQNNGEEKYELLEVEFYLRKEGHEDPFAHATAEQSDSGKWYFHRAPQKSADPTRSATSLSGYRGGTRKGVDLTFGGPMSSADSIKGVKMNDSRVRPGARGGILFRSMRRLSDGAVVSGPSLLVDELLRVCGCASISSLVGEALADDTSAFPSASPVPTKKSSIYIRSRAGTPGKKPTVYSSPRIGLDLSHPGVTASPTDARIVFVQKVYRYFVNPTLLTSNGRPQTFLGIYSLLSEAEILNESGVLDEVSRLTGIKRVSVEKYAADFNEGKKDGNIENFIGPVGKGASSSPSTYLKMMGTLAHLCA